MILKKHAFFLVLIALLPCVLGQRADLRRRPAVQLSKVYAEAIPPDLDSLIYVADLVMVAKVESYTPIRLDTGLIVTRYSVIVDDVVAGQLQISPSRSLLLDMPGGILISDEKISIEENGLNVELALNERYVFFANRYPPTSSIRDVFVLTSGKYAAFRIVSNRIIPNAPGNHLLFEQCAGLELRDFVVGVRARYASRSQRMPNRPHKH